MVAKIGWTHKAVKMESWDYLNDEANCEACASESSKAEGYTHTPKEPILCGSVLHLRGSCCRHRRGVGVSVRAALAAARPRLAVVGYRHYLHLLVFLDRHCSYYLAGHAHPTLYLRLAVFDR